MLGRKVKCQDRSHRKAGNNHLVAGFEQALMLDLDRLVPMLLRGDPEFFDAAAMAGEPRDMHRIPGASQTLGDVPHL
jgi:hypothetical protein